MHISKNAKRRLLHLLFPTKCPICGRIIDYNDDFCKECRALLTVYDGCFDADYADSFTAAFVYDKKISPAIMLLKDGICGNAAFALGKALADAISKNLPHCMFDIIIPVPLHSSAHRRRGFNQSELIAKELSENLGVPLCSSATVKHRKTKEQKSLSRRERQINLLGAFKITKPELINGKRVLIVDDVCTTGSTLSEFAKLLKKNGAAEVHCAVCCKTPILKNEVSVV